MPAQYTGPPIPGIENATVLPLAKSVPLPPPSARAYVTPEDEKRDSVPALPDAAFSTAAPPSPTVTASVAASSAALINPWKYPPEPPLAPSATLLDVDVAGLPPDAPPPCRITSTRPLALTTGFAKLETTMSGMKEAIDRLAEAERAAAPKPNTDIIAMLSLAAQAAPLVRQLLEPARHHA